MQANITHMCQYSLLTLVDFPRSFKPNVTIIYYDLVCHVTKFCKQRISNVWDLQIPIIDRTTVSLYRNKLKILWVKGQFHFALL